MTARPVYQEWRRPNPSPAIVEPLSRTKTDRVHSRTRRPGLLLGLLFLATAAVAGAGPAEDYYDRGLSAFRQGAYAEALEAFLKAREAGMHRAALDYNLGVSYYRLGRYGEAREAFQAAMASPKTAPLAAYNLGLVAVRLGEAEAARSWFRRTLELSDNPKLRGLARTMLARTGGEAPPPKGPPAWNGFVTGDLGYDSNVLLRADSQTITTSEQDDFFLDIFGYGSRRIGGGTGRPALAIDGSTYLLTHRDLTDFNVSALRLGATLEEVLRDWQRNSGLHAAFTFLSGNAFTREILAEVRAQRVLGTGRRLRVFYELARVDAMNNAYAYLDGWRHKANARLSWRAARQRRFIAYQFEFNDRADRTAPRFTSFSPLRHTLRAAADFPLGRDLSARTELRFRRSRYRDPNELADGSLRTRTDNRVRFIARAARRLSGERELFLEYRYTHNNSNIDLYQYTRYRLMLGVFVPF